MSGAALMLALQWVSLLGSLLTAGKLYKSGLHRRYRVFFAYFLFRVPNATIPLFLDVKSHAYFYIWILSEPLIWMFYVWVVLELCRLMLERHPGLYTLGKWAMFAGMGISVTIAVLSILPKFKAAPAQVSISLSTSIVWYVYAADRGVTFCMVIFLLLMLLLLSRYPVALSRNVVVHASLYTLFFLSNALSTLLATLFGLDSFAAVDAASMGVSALCVWAWFFFLTPQGEEARVNIPHFAPENEERILYQLDLLNSTLLRVAHK
jgi:hypothetical protein